MLFIEGSSFCFLSFLGNKNTKPKNMKRENSK